MIRVAIADDQTLVRSGFASLLDDVDDVTVVGEAADGEAAVRLAQQVQPDVVLMDIRMPGVDGLEATRRIVADPACRDVRVVVLTTFELDDYVFAALRAAPAASSPRTSTPTTSARPSGWSPPGTPCCRRRSHAP